MKTATAIMLSLLASYRLYSQEHEYHFRYRFESYKNTTGSIMLNDGALAEQATNSLSSNVQIDGTVFKNGTLLRLFLTNEKITDSINISGNNVVLDLHASSESGDLFTFFNDQLIVKMQGGDTSCFRNDTTERFSKTNVVKRIGAWNCTAYKSINPAFRHLIIWTANNIPSSVAPGYFSGVEGGIAEIDNTEKQMRISLLHFKKENQKSGFPMTCRAQALQLLSFINSYK